MKRSTTRSPELKIRKATISDAEAICEIYNEGIVEGIATFETKLRTENERRRWIREHDRRHPVLVAVGQPNVNETVLVTAKETIQGWGSISTYNPRQCYSGIGEFSVYVKHEYRSSRIGKNLVIALIKEARRLKYWKLIGRIFTSNIASRKLCKSCGFREVGIHKKHGRLKGRWMDIVIVEKLIPTTP